MKYSFDLKMKVVKEYLDGSVGVRLLAREHGITSHVEVFNWINLYKQQGIDGLKRRATKKVYSVQFKIDVLNFLKRTHSSVAETARHFGLRNPSMVSSWNKKFLEGGVEALVQTRGRSFMSGKSKKRSNNKTSKPADKPTREQSLERENELLRLEVEYLKKLNAFQKDPDSYLEKHKQRYHSNSKKDFD